MPKPRGSANTFSSSWPRSGLGDSSANLHGTTGAGHVMADAGAALRAHVRTRLKQVAAVVACTRGGPGHARVRCCRAAYQKDTCDPGQDQPTSAWLPSSPHGTLSYFTTPTARRACWPRRVPATATAAPCTRRYRSSPPPPPAKVCAHAAPFWARPPPPRPVSCVHSALT